MVVTRDSKDAFGIWSEYMVLTEYKVVTYTKDFRDLSADGGGKLCVFAASGWHIWVSPLLDMLRNDLLPKVRRRYPYNLRSVGVFLLLEAAATCNTRTVSLGHLPQDNAHQYPMAKAKGSMIWSRPLFRSPTVHMDKNIATIN